MQLRGQLQSDNAYVPTHDLVFLGSSKSGGAYTPTFQAANQQDHWGYEVTAKPRFDARTETSMGTLRAYAELKIQLDAGAFNAVVGPGQGETGAGNKSELYRGYLQWAGWTIGEADSIWSLGAFKNGDIADVQQTDKSSGWTVFYTWTPSGPGVPPVKGSAPVPDGWSFSAGMDTPLKHISKPQFSSGYQYLFIAVRAPRGLDQAVWPRPPARSASRTSSPGCTTRRILPARMINTTISSASATSTPPLPGIRSRRLPHGWYGLVPAAGSAACLGVTCAFGPAVHDTGWAVGGSMKFWVPMWAGTKLGANRSSNADNIQFEVLYANGALEYGGVGGTMGSLGAGDAYWTGGLAATTPMAGS